MLTRLVSGATDAQFAARVSEFLDLEETARYLAVVVFLSDLDGLLGPGQNYYLYLDPRTQKFSFIAWDQDHSFGQFFRGSQSAREQLSIHHPWSESSRFLDRLFRVDALCGELLGVVEQTFEPRHTSVWLRPPADA